MALANTLLTEDEKYLSAIPSSISYNNLQQALLSSSSALGYTWSWDNGFTASVNLGGQAFTTATGVRIGASLVIDGFGEWGVFNCLGGGGYILSGINPIGVSITITNSPSIYNLSGFSVQIGGSAGEIIGPSFEFLFFKGADEKIYWGQQLVEKRFCICLFLERSTELLKIVG